MIFELDLWILNHYFSREQDRHNKYNLMYDMIIVHTCSIESRT